MEILANRRIATDDRRGFIARIASTSQPAQALNMLRWFERLLPGATPSRPLPAQRDVAGQAGP